MQYMDKRLFYVFGVLTGILLAFVFLRRKFDRLDELEEQERVLHQHNEASLREMEKAVAEVKMESALRKAERRFRRDDEL
jgi:hypothetical protein